MSEHPGIAWLRQQITGRLEAAQKAAASIAGKDVWHPLYFAEWLDGNVTAHIAANDPRQIIAECEAQRAILELHRPYTLLLPRGRHVLDCFACDTDAVGAGYPCPTLRHVASAYRHQPGYTEHWGG